VRPLPQSENVTAAILPSAARDLLYRLTETLEVPFTLLDSSGAVVASTAGRPLGQIDPNALIVLQSGGEYAVQEADLQPPVPIATYSPAAEGSGLLPPEPGLYVPVRVGTTLNAVLMARGNPDTVRLAAHTAAAAAGLGLEFAREASSSARASLGPDLALHALLRGSHEEAKRATLVVKVAGWELLVPRVAVVVMPVQPAAGGLTTEHFALFRDAINELAPDSPVAQFGRDQWVALPALPTSERQLGQHDLARELHTRLTVAGAAVNVGVGEAHIDQPIVFGLRSSYWEAVYAARWGRQISSTPEVYNLRSLGPAAFLAASDRSRRALADELLRPLRAFPDILQTVETFLDANLSLRDAAARAGLHRHTVRHHLVRARELTGLDPRSLNDAVQLKLALLVAAQSAIPQPEVARPDV
jgi:sugar diacid utilization regulator